jgi:ERCC4-type nuclease
LNRDYTIRHDDRENKPLLFPDYLCLLAPGSRKRGVTIGLTVEKRRMKTADYLLVESPRRIIVERKGSLTEVAQNCLTLTGRAKFVDCCKRLRDACDHPYILLEGTIDRLVRTARTYTVDDPWLAVDAFQRLSIEYGVPIIFLPSTSQVQRKAVGQYIAHLLVNGAITNDHP